MKRWRKSIQSGRPLFLILFLTLMSCAKNENTTLPPNQTNATEPVYSETNELVEYDGDMSMFFGAYYLFDSEKNIFEYHDTVDVREDGTVYLDAQVGKGSREYQWKAVSDKELAVFDKGKDLGIRITGITGANPSGYGRLLRNSSSDSSTSQEYIRRECWSDDWGGVYLLWDEDQEKPVPQFWLHENYRELRFYNDNFYVSKMGPFTHYKESDLPIMWSRAFDDEEDYSEFRNNWGEYLYSFRREGNFFFLFEGDRYRGKYLRFSNACLDPKDKGCFRPVEGEDCLFPEFELTEEESIYIDGLKSHRQYGQNDEIFYETCEMHVMGNKENGWIVLYPERLDEYYMTFYTLRPTEEADEWILYAHHEDGSLLEVGRYMRMGE